MAEPMVLDHPLVSDWLAMLRDVNTPADTFRVLVRRLTGLLMIEATRDLATEAVDVTTPMGTASCRRLAERVALAPILRAGLGMVDAALEYLPGAGVEVRHLGMYRDERTLKPVHYYNKLPSPGATDRLPGVAMVLDPMLATGGSAVEAIEALQQWGVGRIKLLAVVAAPEGVARVRRDFPHCRMYVAALDEKLNDIGYIVPGLGDAGDRMFGTT